MTQFQPALHWLSGRQMVTIEAEAQKGRKLGPVDSMSVKISRF